MRTSLAPAVVVALALAAPVARASGESGPCRYVGYHYDAGDGDLHEGVLSGAHVSTEGELRCYVLRDGTVVAETTSYGYAAAGRASFHAVRAELELCWEMPTVSGWVTGCEPLVSTRLPRA